MAIGTPFHERTLAASKSMDWRIWAGYLAAGSYSEFHQPEYAAIRNGAALIDVSPLFKYDVTGPDALPFVNHVFTRDLAKVAAGRAAYAPWCDSRGKVLQEGTIFRLDESQFQINAAEPALRWLLTNASRFDVDVRERTREVAVLSLQGPTSRDVLRGAAGDGVGDLHYFGLMPARLGNVPAMISRTGYTGDLGYEIWVGADRAVAAWDAIVEAGAGYGITPCGLAAMDVARTEAGYILIDVDYIGAESARIDADKSTPDEIRPGWAVDLGKDDFVGKRAIAAEREAGRAWSLIGIEIDWEPLHELYARVGLMPDLPLLACREAVPVYAGGRQVGRVTTRCWSTLLKKYIGLATVETAVAGPGTELEMEITVHYARERAPARVARLPFYRPERLRS